MAVLGVLVVSATSGCGGKKGGDAENDFHIVAAPALTMVLWAYCSLD